MDVYGDKSPSVPTTIFHSTEKAPTSPGARAGQRGVETGCSPRPG